MDAENKIVKNLIGKFKINEEKCFVRRQKRIVVEATKGNFMNVIKYILNDLSFTMLCTITGLDLGDKFQVIYHLANDNGIIIDLKLDVGRVKPAIDTVTEFYKGAILYERELIDLLGIKVNSLPEGNRYPLPDWWPKDQHPLRKDFKIENVKILNKMKNSTALKDQ